MELILVPSEITCPRCGQPVDSLARQCSSCGIDLALAAILAEQTLTSSISFSTDEPLAPEILVPRLGAYLLERGVLNADALQRAGDIHRQYTEQGKPKLFGKLLLELGLVDRDTLDQVITEQILKLQEALQQSNRQLEQRVQDRTVELQRALSKLSQLNELKSNFISNISHELRTPLTHIKGYLSFFVGGGLGALTPEQEEALDVVMRAEARLEKLIDDLIQFSLAARSELSLNCAPTNIKELIQTTLSRVKKQADAKGISLHTSFPDKIPPVWIDTEKIAWVLHQLLDNAIKFSDIHGRVVVDVVTDKNLVTVRVTDNGIGIAPERLNELFEPFHQLDSSDTRRYGGVGLGLALARRIVEAHGSTIRVQSKLGAGTRFEFPLPLVDKSHV
jgi:signal transduction histidine kinase